MEHAAFRRERLQTAVARLRDRLHDVVAHEEDKRRLIASEKAAKPMDAENRERRFGRGLSSPDD